MFISDNPEVNASISRYFKYVHNIKATILIPAKLTNHNSPLSKIFVVQNEVMFGGEVYGIFPSWFDWGIKSSKRMYGLTYSSTDLFNNIINWEDFLKPGALKHFSFSIDYTRIPYFSSTVSLLLGIMKPHGGDSLNDLAAKLHSSFMGVSKRIRKEHLTASSLKKLSQSFITPGSRVFNEFQQKEKKYHRLISYFPESWHLSTTIRSLGDTIDNLTRLNFESETSKSLLFSLLEQSEKGARDIYHFFENLEVFLSTGGKS